MSNSTVFYPRVRVDAAPVGAVGQAGGVLLTRTAQATGLARALREALAPWRKPLAVHDPAKVVLGLAVAAALGGDCLADAALLRAEPGVYGTVASDATISRTIATLGEDADRVLRAVAAARKTARQVAWQRAGKQAPNHGICAADPLVVDIDATIVVAHRRNGPRRRSRRPTGSTPWPRSSTTGRTAPGSR